ncbi:MAG: hypothetical protein OEY09_08450 [Gammaproteobacteria bacterium]|nr:hypothetical protein [Gammaproteobacteria bacterium]
MHEPWPDKFWKVPTAQDVAAIAPVVSTYLPAGARSQEVCPDNAWKVPTSHGVDAIDPVKATKDPGGDTRQEA